MFPIDMHSLVAPVFPFLAVVRLSFDGGKEGRVQRGKERNKLGLGEIKSYFRSLKLNRHFLTYN